ncbi:calcium-binding and coiled-coil domain-containing protein 2 [Myiozetetes cayanensis]|uniref:calcium-binding and coiled-coil domain-containing protein 2 n=1 Tax=Myiozetetes cayanensis TaxID=478635 RepID=UPI00215E859E|nr:calcium-binding and coiled-coil domain-containing protein 2 [Myiozetetes cayanensis]XP_050183905.1 calcium-binding and coiled-coil domain-containing protein 2 [Myiozetetes cayanensis]
MDDSCDDPPTSAVLLDSCHFSQVLFNNVEKFYVPGADVTCYYTLTQNITARGKDWVGIFRVGWKTTREYYTFMWAPLPAADHSGTAVQQNIQFKAYYLPKDDEYYQFCYVDQDGMVRGASVPFQFRAETEDDILVVTTQGEVEEIELQNKNLQEENEELKASCANLQKQNVELQEELKKTQELQKSLESLRSNTEKLELEVNSLKMENKHLKEQGDCREAELQQLKEQIQSVSSEKERLEGRLKTALEHMDQLQSQVLSYEKEVENLSHMGQDKTEQLETLKEENHQLRLSTAQQQHDLMKELEKQKHLFQVLQAEKDETDEESQKLRAENSALLRHLSQAAEFAPLSALPRAPVPAPAAGDLLFGNPYSAAGGNLGAGAEASLRICPMCDEVFPEDVDTSQYEAHVQSHLVECPICTESFEKSNKQVFEDHLLCHKLE